MGAIRVQAFQEGGSMLFPGMLDQQVQPPPAQQPPVTQLGNSPLPQPPPASAINTQPPVTEMPTDDNIELDKARREDDPILQHSILSHYGDHRFVTPRPQQPTEETITADPEWAKIQQGKQVIDDYVRQNPGAKRAEITAGINLLKSKETALRKRYIDTYKAEHNTWKMNEVQQLKGIEGDRLTGAALEQNWAGAEEARNTFNKKLEGVAGPRGEMERAGSAATNLTPQMYNEAAVRIGQYNNLPTARAGELLNFLAAPNGPYNGRKGAAAANYKIAGRDVVGNVWLDTEQGRIRVPPNIYEQIELARRKGYKAIQGLETKYRAQPPSRSAGQWVADQLK